MIANLALVLLAGTSLRPPEKTFTQTVREADAILIGTVVHTQSRISKGGGNIFTFVTLDRLEILDGDYPFSSLTLRYDGGEIEDPETGRMRGIEIADAPRIEHGERLLLFVYRNGRAMFPTVGWNRGLFRIERDAGGREVVRTALTRQEVVGLERDHILVKPEPIPSPEVIVSEETDPRLVAERRTWELELRARDERLSAARFGLEDFRKAIRERAKELRASGLKPGASRLVSADPEVDRDDRDLRAIAPQVERRPR